MFDWVGIGVKAKHGLRSFALNLTTCCLSFCWPGTRFRGRDVRVSPWTILSRRPQAIPTPQPPPPNVPADVWEHLTSMTFRKPATNSWVQAGTIPFGSVPWEFLLSTSLGVPPGSQSIFWRRKSSHICTPSMKPLHSF